MIEITFFIPTVDNDGVRFQESAFGAFEAKASELFGGFSQLPGIAAGGWVDQGRHYRDTHRVYAVFLGSIADGAKVASLAAWVRESFRQEAVTIRYLGLAEIL